MRILFISQFFAPEQPDLRGLPFARELQKHGHKVQILTGFPNYPGGKIYPGYKIKFFQREIMDGVEVLRVPLYPSHDQSAIKRIFNYFSFALSAAIIGLFVVKKADVQYVYQPPATVSIPALVIKYLRRIPIVYDIQDLWPDTLKATGMVNSDLIIRMVDLFCKFCYKTFDQIVVLSRGFKEIISQRGVNAEDITIINNWSNDLVEDSSLPEVSNYIGQFKDKFSIVFAGNIGKAQALDSVLEAASLIQQYTKIQFYIIGDGVEVPNLKETALKLNLTNVTFLPRIPTEAIGPVLSASDALLVHIKNDKLFEITIPSKIQAYLRTGKPIIMAVKGDAADIVLKAKAGVFCDPEEPKELAQTIIKLYEMDISQLAEMGQNGKAYYDANLSIEIGTKKMLEVFNRVTAKNASR